MPVGLSGQNLHMKWVYIPNSSLHLLWRPVWVSKHTKHDPNGRGGKRSSKKRFDEKIRYIDSGKKHGILGPVVHANKRAFTPNNVRSRLFHASFTMFHATDPWNGLWAFATRNQLGDSFLAAKRVANFGGISLQFDMHVLYKMLLPADRHLHNYAGWLVHLVCCTRGFQCIDSFI